MAPRKRATRSSKSGSSEPRGERPAGDLSAYEAKRDFAQTPEPPPEARSDDRGPLTFVVQQHRATRMHYDVRLEVGGAMPSWPVPKGPSLNPADRRLAIRTEDHPLDYASFEGLIPKGQYGAGEVIVWDNGTYSPDEDGELSFGDRAEAEARVQAGIAAGKLSVVFRGRKLKGSWAFVKTKASEDSWLLIKHRDDAADAERELVAEGASVISGLTIEDLQAGRLPDPAQEATPPHLADLPGVVRGPLPADVQPMHAALARAPFSSDAWVFEPKLDGIRAIVTVEDGVARLRSRRGNEITAQYPALAAALGRQPVSSAVFDGEIVALDDSGVPSFEQLQQRMNLQGVEEVARADATVPVLFFPFDLLALDGFDLRRVPLVHRLEVLARVVLPSALVQPLPTFAGDGETAYAAAVELGLEGVVAKRRDSVYEAGRRSQRWLKVKARLSDDFVVGGYHHGRVSSDAGIPGGGGRSGTLGALLIGTYGEDGALHYAGRVGTGFDGRTLEELRHRLDGLASEVSPFAEEVPDAANVTFAEPALVAEVEYAQRTREGVLRAPSFVRLRDDKAPGEVRAAATVEPAEVAPDPEIEAVVEQLAGLDGAREAHVLAVEGQELRVTNLDKVMWPETATTPAVTKRGLLRYLAEVSPWLLPHLRDRPLTLTRYPNGIEGESFYQKHYDAPPPFVESVQVYVDSSRGDERAILCDNLATLLWLGQLADLELHVSLARVSPEPDGEGLSTVFAGSKEQVERSLLNYPDFVLFDFDPYIYAGTEAAGAEPELNREAFGKAVEAARWLKELLDGASLRSFVKTSGATGLHIYVPVRRTLDYGAVRSVAATFGDFLLRAHPREITLEWSVEKRRGKIFLDVNQNARIKNLAVAYSPRPKPGAPVSMPLRWEELDEVYPTDFTVQNALGRLREVGDPWADILRHKQDLSALLDV